MGPHGSLVSTEIPTERGTEKLDGPPCGHSMGNVTLWNHYWIRYRTRISDPLPIQTPCDFFRLLRNVNGWRSVFNDPDFLSRCEFMRIDILKVVFWNRAYTLREEKHGCGRFALRWKIYARRNIDGNLREFSNLNGKSSLEIRVTTSRGRRKHCHGWWTSHRAPGKNLLPVPISQDRWERSRREAGEKVNHRWKRRFSRSGSGSLVPMGKMVPRLLRLLHTLIYFKRGGRDILSFRGGRVPFTDLFDGYWRSRHRRRTLLPVSQWKQDTYLLLFVGRFLRPLILSHSWEVGWLCVEGSSSSGRVACEGECCVSCYKRKSIHFSIVAPWYEYNVRLLPRSSLEF